MAVESLDWFVQLAESGTFTRASEELQVSQQTLSSRLAALERELDTRLVVRGRARPSSPTPSSSATPASACCGSWGRRASAAPAC